MHVIYLTGAPATGKSSLCDSLGRELDTLEIIEYGEELTSYINSKRKLSVAQSDLREKSSALITEEDVSDVDEIVLQKIADHRRTRHVLLDSHAVTKEYYGFRVTAFSGESVRKLRPTIIVCLYADADTILNRISKNSMGRPTISRYEAEMHNGLQSSLAVTYGIEVGVPVYFLDTNKDRNKLVSWIANKLSDM